MRLLAYGWLFRMKMLMRSSFNSWLGVLYPLAQSFAVVYTGNHYVVDLFIGYVYAAAALAGVWWFWRRRQLPE